MWFVLSFRICDGTLIFMLGKIDGKTCFARNMRQKKIDRYAGQP